MTQTVRRIACDYEWWFSSLDILQGDTGIGRTKSAAYFGEGEGLRVVVSHGYCNDIYFRTSEGFGVIYRRLSGGIPNSSAWRGTAGRDTATGGEHAETARIHQLRPR